MIVAQKGTYDKSKHQSSTSLQYKVSTDRVVLAVVAQYELCFNESFHHALVQGQFVLVGRCLGQLCRIVLNVDKQCAYLFILHLHRPAGP